MNRGNNELDILSIISVLLGLQNLNENRQQSEHNDVQIANDKQAQYILQEINAKFEETNQILHVQNVALDRIKKMLEGKE